MFHDTTNPAETQDKITLKPAFDRTHSRGWVCYSQIFYKEKSGQNAFRVGNGKVKGKFHPLKKMFDFPINKWDKTPLKFPIDE